MNLPDNYCDEISDNQTVKATGNGWEVGMVTHIFNQMAAQADKERGEEKNIITAHMHEPSFKTKLNRMDKTLNKHQTATDVYTVLPTGTGNLLELFAGSRSVGKVGERLGYNVFSIDWKEYEGIDLAIDIGNLTKEDVPFVPDVVWASPDCTTYSIAACSTHRTNSIEPKSEYAKKCNQVNEHFIGLIKEWLKINPKMVFFIENPRGMLRKMPFMQEFKRHTIWYCQYGDDRAKPTDIWTNSEDWKPRPQCKNGNPNCHHQRAPRGSKTGTQGRKGSYERSIIPHELCLEVLSSACG